MKILKYLLPVAMFAVAGVAHAATLAVSPASQALNVGDIFTVTVVLNTQSVAIDGVDITNLNYNPTLLQFQGSQVTAGSLMANTIINTVDHALGKITFSQVPAGGTTYTGSGNLVTMSFQALSAGTANLTFDYTSGNTLDSNIASDGSDLLNAVTNGQYTITGTTVIPPVIPPTIPPVIPPTTPSPSDPPATTTAVSQLKLINASGTFYLIQSGQRKGVTNPGMLYTYGFEFKDAKIATEADLLLPEGGLLLPDDGALVKSVQDQTVYLISRRQRHGFVSSKVFTDLGFKFSSVLVVTNPELQALPTASNLSDATASHLPGLDINLNGTVYYLGSDSKLYGYPSLDIYNSWHIDNDFSRVVPANSADTQFPVGTVVTERVIN